MPDNLSLVRPSSRPASLLADRESVERSHRRCRTEYGLLPDLMRPILKIQRSELTLRSQAFRNRMGAGMRHIGWLSGVVAKAGALLIVSDATHVALALEETEPFPADFNRNGITPGSCWDERIAGTNGIQMALDLGRCVTVRGKDHFYTSLQGFSCTAVPIVDEDGETLGALNVATVDGLSLEVLAHYHHLLEATANLLQEDMFRRRYAEHCILSLKPLGSPAERNIPNALIALDGTGTIVGATEAAARLLGARSTGQLITMPASAMLDLDADAILRDGQTRNLLRDAGGSGGRAGIMVAVSHPAAAVVSHFRRDKPGPTGAKPATPSPAAPVPPARLPPYLSGVAREAAFLLARGVPVALDGESGTGKTTIGRGLQRTAAPGEGGFLALDCAEFTEGAAFAERVRSWLDRPHPVGAGAARVLMLDNVDLAPQVVQVAATAVLHGLEQAGQFRALRGRGQQQIRVLSCFSREIEQLASACTLRGELLFLLQGERLTLPPLRSDPQLATTLAALAEEIAGAPVRIEEPAMEALLACRFPGNLREARAILHHALAMSGAARIALGQLPRYLLAAPPDPAVAPRDEAGEAQRIAEALAVAGWNVSQAARRLGISRATINRKMRTFGLARPTREVGAEPAGAPAGGRQAERLSH